jgi:hypothetical protein
MPDDSKTTAEPTPPAEPPPPVFAPHSSFARMQAEIMASDRSGLHNAPPGTLTPHLWDQPLGRYATCRRCQKRALEPEEREGFCGGVMPEHFRPAATAPAAAAALHTLKMKLPSGAEFEATGTLESVAAQFEAFQKLAGV